MENDILDSLNDVGYDGPLTDEVQLAKALDAGPKSLEYTKLVHLLAEELKRLLRMEEAVGLMSDPDDSNMFLMELSSFLKELGCPYKNMITGHISARLQSRAERILLLDYLLSELMAARMVSVDQPSTTESMNIVVHESPTAKDLKEILIALKFNKPPANITAEVLFNKLYTKLKETIDKEGQSLVGKPLYNKNLTEKQWKELENSFSEMLEEYKLRRETLITRLECTIQSFEWSDRMKHKKEEIQSVYRPHREALKSKPDVQLSHFLAARTTLLHVEKTSSAAVRKDTQSDLNKVIIGRVPDRGGRPSEQQPPPPEMPSWQQRQPGGGGGFGGGGRGGGRGGDRGGRGGDRGGRGGDRGGRGGDRGGRGGGGGGGRVQGGWNQSGGDRDQNRGGGGGGNYNRQSSAGHGGFQTYEVPPGGYNQNGQSSYSSGVNYQPSSGSYNKGYSSGGAGYQSQGQAYGQSQGGYGQGGSGYQNSSSVGGYQSSGAGYQTSGAGYQSSGTGYQTSGSGYQTSGGGYQSSGGYQSQGRYQNEHDDRTNDRDGQRGRSNYNRGGRR